MELAAIEGNGLIIVSDDKRNVDDRLLFDDHTLLESGLGVVAVEGAVTHPLPAQIPACGFLAPGSSDSLASATRHYRSVYAIPRSEVGLVDPTLHVRTGFPLRATAACQPLPHVNGPTVSEYYGLIRLPGDHRLLYLSFRFCLPEHCPGATRVSQVPGASLHASHALCGPRQTLGALTLSRALYWLLVR